MNNKKLKQTFLLNTDWILEKRDKVVNFETISSYESNLSKRLDLQNMVNSPRNTLITLSKAINRKLADMMRNTEVVKDKEFNSSNVWNGMLKELVKESTSKRIQHKHPIEKKYQEKLSTYFMDALNNQFIYRRSGYFNLAINFLSRGKDAIFFMRKCARIKWSRIIIVEGVISLVTKCAFFFYNNLGWSKKKVKLLV